MLANSLFLWVQKAICVITGIAGAYLYRKLTAPPETKMETCFMALNVNAQMHVLKEEICSLKYCSYKGFKWLLDQIDNAEKQLDVMMYFLTYPVFTNAFIRAKARGVRLRFILQFDKSDEGSEWVRLRREHIPIRMMNVPPNQLMHTKLLIIDQTAVVFGSMNFTFSGLTENHEEMVRSEEKETVRRCRDYFYSIWESMSEHDRFTTECRKMGEGDIWRSDRH